jgi:adenine-specific DNA-methyltransferase
MSLDKITKGDELTQSLDIVNDNIARLKELFPEVLTEGKIDFKVLQDILGKEIEEEEEYYRFTWAGKAQARREAHKPSTGTLRPVKEESVNWETTENLYIEGDNLEVLKLLQKSYAKKVKVIYIDPPYNTGNDFVYKDNYKDNLKNYQELTGQIDDEGNKLTTNSDSDGRFHSNWLNMMYPRLQLAKNLLKEDGVIFISIDDNEQANLKRMCDEIFGSESFVALFPWRKRTAKSDVPFGISQDYEWILVFANPKFIANLKGKDRKYYETSDLPSRPWRIHDLTKQTSSAERPNSFFTIINPKNGDEYPANPLRTWAITKESIVQYLEDNRIVFPGDYDFLNISKPAFRYFKEDDEKKSGDLFGYVPVSTNLPPEVGMSQNGTKDFGELFENKLFSFPKSISLLKHLISCSTNFSKDAIILDFFSGSATSGQAIMQLNNEDGGNRKFIQVQLPELTDKKSEAYNAGYKTIAEIGKERIRRAGKLIIDKKLTELEKLKSKNSLLIEDQDEINDLQSAIDKLDTGFKVFKLDSSNIKGWDGNPDNLVDNLFDSQDNIKTGRTEEDVLFEILLKYGLDLTLPIEEKTIEGKKVFSVGFGALFICLTDGITSKVAEGIGAWKEALKPEVCRVIFKDSGFGDVEKTNSVQTLKRFGIHEIKSI